MFDSYSIPGFIRDSVFLSLLAPQCYRSIFLNPAYNLRILQKRVSNSGNEALRKMVEEIPDDDSVENVINEG